MTEIRSDQERQTFYPTFWHVIRAVACLIFVVACIVLLVVLLFFSPSLYHSKERFELFLVTPIALLMLVMVVKYALRFLARGTKRYRVTPDAGIELGLSMRKRMQWKNITDYAIPPAKFPKIPDTLILFPHAGKPFYLPLDLLPKASWLEQLKKHLPLLRDCNFQAVRQPKVSTTPSAFRIMLAKNPFLLLGLFYAFMFTLLFVLLTFIYSYEWIQYLRIRSNPVAVSGTVIEIDRSGDPFVEPMTVKVSYQPYPDRTWEISRQVKPRFTSKYKINDLINLEYLHGKSYLVRIPDWDMDSESWKSLLKVLVLAWLGVLATVYLYKKCFKTQPLKFQFKSEKQDEQWVIRTKRPFLGFNYAAFPDRHYGRSILVKEIQWKDSPVTTTSQIQKTFKKNGIETYIINKNMLFIDSRSSEILFDRLGMEDEIEAEYVILNLDTKEEIEQWVGNNSTDGKLNDNLHDDGRVEFVACKSLLKFPSPSLGPFDSQALPNAFNAFVKTQLSSLYSYRLPSQLADTDYTELLNVDPADKNYHCLAQRVRDELEVWLQLGESKTSSHAILTNERWLVQHDQPTPDALLPGLAFRIFFRLFIWTIIPVLFIILFPVKCYRKIKFYISGEPDEESNVSP